MIAKKPDYSNILFGYSFTPTFGCYEKDDGGFSIELYASGNLIYNTYIFDHIEKKKKGYIISSDAVDEIKDIFENHKEEISSFNENIDNGSCDGDFNDFVFDGKHISTLNIDYYDEEEVKERNPEYYNEYLPVIRQENKMLSIFEEVVFVLRKYGVQLNLYKVIFSIRLKKLKNT